jgi:superfamily II DNA/RNA helicase
LLSVVAIQSTIQVVDVTHDNDENTESEGAKKGKAGNSSGEAENSNKGKELVVALPKQLLQYEIRVPTEDKDAYTYYYLIKVRKTLLLPFLSHNCPFFLFFLQNEGRTLIFVNSIKTARRLDGLLRALQFHCRTIHGDLPQKQRLKALETFSSSPRGILVATDVAARGLDIAKIQSVIHYDIARTPQVYVHRSGRTARANTSGKTISFVTPDDYSYHQAIVEYVTGKKANSLSASSSSSMIIPYPVDSAMLNPLRERITLAKKVSIPFNFVSFSLLLFLTFLLDFYSKFYSF